MKDTAIDKLQDVVRNANQVIAGHARSTIKECARIDEAVKKFPAFVNSKTHIILHHSLTKDSLTASWPAIRKYHKYTLGWVDIGYHAGIEEIRYPGEYEILIGRDYFETGAHCPQGQMNRKGFGFCFTGNFDVLRPPERMLDKAAGYLASVCRLGNISPDNIKGHRDFNPHKSCPGKLFDIDDFRNRVFECL